MNILIYNDLDVSKIAGFEKICKFLRSDDFKSAEVKKIDDNLYRAKLNRSDRILFSIYQYAGKKYALILEYLKSHDYENSRFLQRGVVVDEERIPVLTELPEQTAPSLAYVNQKQQQVAWLNKAISFDECQAHIYQQRPPMILIGSAGSGKTALLLEKLKKVEGDVLYVTLSSFLVKYSQELYYSHDYKNEQQNVDFFSFEEVLESIAVPQSKPISFRIFSQWYQRHVRNVKITESAHKLFEEFRGVLTGGTDAAYLSQDGYVDLGVKQSIYAPEVRRDIYDAFLKYMSFLKENNYHDSNMLSFEYVQQIEPRYDFVVVDEVQDLTTIQLLLILKMLRQQGDFLLCGDSNQIVHPNFFSWANIKTLFYKQDDLNSQNDFLHILQTNYRNSPQVTELANRILLLKQARFGSIDRESNYLVQSNGHVQGAIRLLHDKATIVQELDIKTKHSTRFAVVVMRDEQKIEAQRFFQTPLVFSIQEAKGLEYENIILYNFISAEDKSYQYICEGVNPSDLKKELKYSRNKEKNDKSLEVYKFYINALYVALTRAVSNLYWIESNSQHRMLGLLGFGAAADDLNMTEQQSSMQDWQREAHKLELQGKQEQADRIRQEVLKEQKPDWPVYTQQTLNDLVEKALVQGDKKAKLMLFEYAIVYENLGYMHRLSESGFNPAKQYATKPEVALKALKQKHYMIYGHANKVHPVMSGHLSKFGLDFNNIFAQTPLIAAVWMGDVHLAKNLISMGADIEQADNRGFNPLLVAIQQATLDQKYAKHAFSVLYDLLKTDSLSVQIDGRLLKIKSHTMEYLILHLMFVFAYRFSVACHKIKKSHTVTVSQIKDAIAYFPDYIVSDHRKKLDYISGVISENEINVIDIGGKNLFMRTQLGGYILNPKISLNVQGEWKYIYDWLPIDEGVDLAMVVEEKAFDELSQGVWTDPNTGLMWMRCSMGQKWNGTSAYGKVKEYTWSEAQKVISDMNASGGFAGHTDWQLPNIDMLKTLMIDNEEGYNCPEKVLCKPNGYDWKLWGVYWSASSYEANTNQAWGVYFGNGSALNGRKSHSNYVRAVRITKHSIKQKHEEKQKPLSQLKQVLSKLSIGSKTNSVTALDNGVWIDPITGLMWMRYSMGQVWDGATAQGDAKTYTWDAAHKVITEMNNNGGFAGFTDWTLPDISTLKTLSIEGKQGYKHPDGMLLRPNRHNWGEYWSASPVAGHSHSAWYLDFYDGHLGRVTKDSVYLVRAFRVHEKLSELRVVETTKPSFGKEVSSKYYNVLSNLLVKQKPANELDQGVWTDPNTGLMWMRCSMGQTWDGVTAQGDAKTYTWDNASQAIEQMNKKGGFAGYTDWQLPDFETLKTLMVKSEAGYNCPQDVLLPPKAGFFGLYWSASPNPLYSLSALHVNFYNGYSGNYDKDYGLLVRAVRAVR